MGDAEVLGKGYAKVAVLGRDVVYVKLSTLSSRMFGRGWTTHHGTFLLGYPADIENAGLELPLAQALELCEELDGRCGGVTCDGPSCTVRAGTNSGELLPSPIGEDS